jgi:hypothetical protein
MRENAMVIFIIILVIAGCVIAGCSSLPFSNPGPQPTPQETPRKVSAGLVGESGIPATVQRYPFKETLADISSQDLSFVPGVPETAVPEFAINKVQANVSPQNHIISIRGTDIDETANAISWTYMIEHGGKTTIITYGPQGITRMDGSKTTNQTEIIIDQIIPPRDLLMKNQAVLLNITGTRDLYLNGNYYVITITDNGKRQNLVFDAKTGGLKS